MSGPRAILRHLLLVVCFLLLTARAAYAAETGDLPALRSYALDLVNAARREHGLAALTASDALDEAAQAHAADMLERDYYDHVSPEGRNARDRYIANGGDRYELVAENIAMCSGCAEVPRATSVDQMQRGWMDSPDHRRNILSEGVTKLGFGIVAGAGRVYAVQTFAGPGSPQDKTSAAPGPAGGEGTATLDQAGVDDAFVRALNARRDARSRAALQVSDELTTAAAALLPETSAERVALGRGGLDNLTSDWSSTSTLVGSCGGCGTEVTAVDIDQFLDMWLQEPVYADRLLGTAPNAAGFALRAYGDGRKMAVVVLGRQP